jgi:hypothetical protein
MIQRLLEAIPTKKKEKRTLVTFFLKEESHPFKDISSKSRSMIQSRSYKKERKKNVNNILSQRRTPPHSKPTFQDPIRADSRKIP